jgi:hypothetical protein
VWVLYQSSLTRSTSTLFFHLPRVCVPTERGPGVGSSPRPVGYCSTRVGIRTKNGALYLATMNDQSSNAIHPSAWKVHSPKLITVGSPLRPQRPLPGLLMDTPPYFPDEFFGIVRRK